MNNQQAVIFDIKGLLLIRRLSLSFASIVDLNRTQKTVKMSKLILAFFLAVVIAQVIAEPQRERRRSPEARLARVERRVARIHHPNSFRGRRLRGRELLLRSEIPTTASSGSASPIATTASSSSDTASATTAAAAADTATTAAAAAADTTVAAAADATTTAAAAGAATTTPAAGAATTTPAAAATTTPVV